MFYGTIWTQNSKLTVNIGIIKPNFIVKNRNQVQGQAKKVKKVKFGNFEILKTDICFWCRMTSEIQCAISFALG